jgi:hypothetical protein
MSCQETIKGVIKKVDLMYKTPEKYAKDLLNGLGKDTLPTYYDSWIKYLCNEYYYEFLYIKGTLFKFVEYTDVSDESDYCHIKDNKDGTYSFITSFYNGGTCLQEMLEDGLKKIL